MKKIEYKLNLTRHEYSELVITFLNKSGGQNNIPDNEKTKQQKRIDRIYEELSKQWTR